MASQTTVAKIQNNIDVITAVLTSCGPGHPDVEYYNNVLADLKRQLAQVQERPASYSAINSASLISNTPASRMDPSALPSLKRRLGPAEVPEPKRLSATSSPLHPETPDYSFEVPIHQPQQQWLLPNRSARNSNANTGPRNLFDFGEVDFTRADPSAPALRGPPHIDPFPELDVAFRDNIAHPEPVDAFNQEWLSSNELAQFLLAPTPADGGYAFQPQQQQFNAPLTLHRQNNLNITHSLPFEGAVSPARQVPYLPGPQHPFLLQDSDGEDYGEFPLNVAEADAIEKMLESIQQHEDTEDPDDREQTPRIMKSTLKEYQKIGLTWLLKQEDGRAKGCILADEMGLGKTVQALALICARPSQDPLCKTTLVIAPVALMRQWEKEIAFHVHARYRLRVYLYWGKGKKADFSVLRQHDVVLTTFGTLTSEFNQKDSRRETMLYEEEMRNPRFRRKPQDKLALLGRECMWYRIIIDEAHMIRNRNAKASKAASDLQARHRLCMTGTPMMNSIDELYPLLRFLRVDRYNDWRIFSVDIVRPAKHKHPATRKKAIQRVQILLKTIMLRRQKTSEVDGKPILQLPPKHISVNNVEFSDDEQAIYKALEAKSQIQFNKYLKTNSVSANYASILVLLLRLRQACCHPHLIKDLSQPATEGIAEDDLLERACRLPDDVVERLKNFDSFECPICLEADPNPTIIIPCGHTVCGVCVRKLIDPDRAGQEIADDTSAPRCPHCRGELQARLITDFKHFCRVHCPERLDSEDRVEEGDDTEEDSDSECDSEDFEDCDRNDVNEKGNLAGFVVSDEDDSTECSGLEDHVDDGVGDSWMSQHNTKEEAAKPGKRHKGKVKARSQPKKTLAELKKNSLRNKAAKKKYLRRLEKTWIPSAKILQTVEILSRIQKEDPTEKTLIFSQFTSLLDLLEVPLLRKGFQYQRYDGSMTMQARADAVETFMENPQENIMLVSLKAGNAGLNLWRASVVIILDPFWNPYVEDQAVDRAHRMPQEREVTVHRVLVPETVEDRICALQDKKRDIIGQALDEKEAKSLTRLGIRELKYLFGLA